MFGWEHAAVPCYTSLNQALNQDRSYLPTAKMKFHVLPRACLHLFFHANTSVTPWCESSGSSIDRKKNDVEEEKTGSSCELSSMNWLTVGSKRHCCKGGESSRIASFQAAGQQIHPATVPLQMSLGFPPISSGKRTAREQARSAHISSWKLLYHKVNFPLHQQAHLITPVHEH